MANKIVPIQDSFNAGEFGKRMQARVNFDKYVNAGATLENVMPLPQGGWTYRPGFRYIANAKSASVRPWLIPFVFATEQSDVMEFGDNRVRWYRNQGQIAAPATDATITNGTFDAGITGWTDSSAGTGAISYNAALSALSLDGAGAGNEAKARQSVSTTSTGVLHVLRFYIDGDPGDTVVVRVGSTAGGSEYLSDASRDTGWHCVEFTPAASPFFVEFECALNKSVPIDDVLLLDDAAVELETGRYTFSNIKFLSSVTISIIPGDILIHGSSLPFIPVKQSIEFSIIFVTKEFTLSECLTPIASISWVGISLKFSILALTASLISLVTYAIKSDILTI